MKENSLLRVSAEGADIVVSILLALAVDAAWDARQAAVAEVAVIRSLLGEIDVADGYLDGAIREHSRVMAGAEAWGTVSRDVSPDSIARLVRLVTWYRTPNLALSSADALVSSGQLGLIRDDALRSWIAAWPGVEEDLDEEIGAALEFARFVAPEFFTSTGVPRAAADGRLWQGGTGAGLEQLIGDPRFANLYFQAWEVSEVFVREAEIVRQTLRTGAELGRAALGRSGG